MYDDFKKFNWHRSGLTTDVKTQPQTRSTKEEAVSTQNKQVYNPAPRAHA